MQYIPRAWTTTSTPAAADQVVGLSAAARLAAEQGLITTDQAETWITEVRDAAGRGRFFLSLTLFTVVGEKPRQQA